MGREGVNCPFRVTNHVTRSDIQSWRTTSKQCSLTEETLELVQVHFNSWFINGKVHFKEVVQTSFEKHLWF